MTSDELMEMCVLWQSRLGLRDWRIMARFADSGELAGAQGNAHYQREKKLGVINILRPEGFDQTDDYNKAFPDIFDPERTLIHELLHAHFDGLFEVEEDTDKHTFAAQEQAIEQITTALYEAYRERNG